VCGHQWVLDRHRQGQAYHLPLSLLLHSGNRLLRWSSTSWETFLFLFPPNPFQRLSTCVACFFWSTWPFFWRLDNWRCGCTLKRLICFRYRLSLLLFQQQQCAQIICYQWSLVTCLFFSFFVINVLHSVHVIISAASMLDKLWLEKMTPTATLSEIDQNVFIAVLR